MSHNKGLKVVVDFSIVTGLALIGQYVLDVRGFWNSSAILSAPMARLALTLVFWAAFAVLLKGVVGFHRVAGKVNKEIAVLSSLGLVVAISSLGQFAVKGLQFFQASFLPFFVVRLMLVAILVLAFYFVARAVLLYRRL